MAANACNFEGAAAMDTRMGLHSPCAVLGLAMLAAGVPACSKAPAAGADLQGRSDAADPESPEMLRESARAVLGRNCGECHTSTLPTALPRALAVYDLARPEWSRRMSADQLREAERRLHEPIAPTLGEDEARPVVVSEEELRSFHRYVEIEVGRRDGS